MIHKDRLADTFHRLVTIDSISREEREFARTVWRMLADLGGEVIMDGAGERVGGNAGNLIARFPGEAEVPPLLLSGHMDTVEPGRGIEPVLADGRFTSRGDTILGADDKSAIAIILEVLQVLKERRHPHGPIEVVLTVCEEVGLQGAKNLDFSLITAPYGYALDARDTEGIVTQAPGANRFVIDLFGRDAHAGASPEKGINAIWLAGKALAALELGRIDHETTCNIGLIEGGKAINIVPDRVTLKGEARSHDPDKLDRTTQTILTAFEKVVEAYRPFPEERTPRAEVQLEREYLRTHIPEDHPVVALARKAARGLGRNLIAKTTGGGSDANIFFEKGIPVGVLGTGMEEVHSVREWVKLDDMVRTAELVLGIIRYHGTS